MDREAFDRKYAARLNRQQQEAVHAVEGPVLLLAVPGSGKTTVLVTRLGYMLCCCGIAPDQILTMTYTRAAAGEMKQRFAALFGQDCPHPPEIRTINGVSSKIIAYYAQNCGKRPPFILAEDESALAKLVSDLYRDLCGEYPTQSVVKELRKSIAYAKNMMLPEERLGGNGLFARITVFPGREIDYHEHHGETETYPIIAGEGVYSDNGAERAIHAGDTFFCDDGGGHGIRNTGADDLVFIALIIRK